MRFPYKALGITSAIGIALLLGSIVLHGSMTPKAVPSATEGFTLLPGESVERAKEEICAPFAPTENAECLEAAELVLKDYAGAIQSAKKEEITLLQGESREAATRVAGTFWVVNIALESPVETPEGIMRSASVVAHLQEQRTILYQLSPDAL